MSTHRKLLAAAAVCLASAGLMATASEGPDTAAAQPRPVEVRPLPDAPSAAYEALRERALRQPVGDPSLLTPVSAPPVATPQR